MEEKKKKPVKTDNWIRPDIVVKVITKRLGEKYYKKKAVIRVSQRCEHKKDSCSKQMLMMCVCAFTGGAGQIHGYSKADRLGGQTETGPKPPGDSDPSTG